MKKTLLFTTKKITFYSFLAFCMCFNYGWSQTNLVLNGTLDEYTHTTSDNADGWNMTPPELIKNNAGTDVASPYNALWNNTALYTYLKDTYNSGSDVDQQGGSSSDGTYSGTTKTRSIKLYGDGVPAVSASTRRLYQKIAVTANTMYTFKIDSRSEFAGIPTEIFILNEEITTEVGLENKGADTRVDAYFEITNDNNSSTGSATNNTFTTTTFNFTASGSFVVIYIRALLANSGTTEVFYDNIELYDPASASVKEDFATNFSLYPNPSKGFINIQSKNVEISKVQLYNVTGQKVLDQKGLVNNGIDVSNFAKGIYVLKIESGDKFYTNKVIVE